MLGCNSNLPTVFISSATGQNTSGKVGIGTTDIPNGYKLAVDGKIIATELKIQLKNLWPPDYVFEKNYHLMSIPELKDFIEKNNDVGALGVVRGPLRSIGAQHVLRRHAAPGLDAAFFNDVRGLVKNLHGARVQLARFLVDKEGDGHAPRTLAADAPIRAACNHVAQARAPVFGVELGLLDGR